MKQFIGMLVVITLVCCLAFCEEPSDSPYQTYQNKAAAVEKVVPEQPKKKSDRRKDPVSMF